MKLPVKSFILFFYSVEMIINCIKIQIVRPFKVRGSANKKNQILERVKYLDFFSFARWYSIHNEFGSYLRFWFPCGIFNKCMTDIILREMFWISTDFFMINISSPTSRCRKRNCLFKFDKSIVSMSITSISPKPNNARFFNISQPSPPAPITKIRHCSCKTKIFGNRIIPIEKNVGFRLTINNLWRGLEIRMCQRRCSTQKCFQFIETHS